MSLSTVSYLWREPKAALPFPTGVSLHSHTNQSRETLDFIAELSTDWRFLQPIMRFAEGRCKRLSGIRPDYIHGYWTPPLHPSAAFALEARQIATLELDALVSLSDHDDIRAPQLLRSLPSAPDIPISTEWTVPFARGADATCFHLGIHNLPPTEAGEWMTRFAALTAMAVDDVAANAILTELLASLNDLPGVLLIFNHPLWDLYRIGQPRHQVLVNEFLAVNGGFLHALELNGLRNWRENREVAALAGRWNMLPISGGDRHGVEPNANINLSQADSFAGFVHEVRRERTSHVLFMPQYAEPWKHRILQSTLAAVRNHPDLPLGSQRWDERVFHPDATGEIKSLASLWVSGEASPSVNALLAAVRLLGARPLAAPLRYAWSQNRTEALAKRLALAEA